MKKFLIPVVAGAVLLAQTVASNAAVVAIAAFGQQGTGFASIYTGVVPPGASTFSGTNIPVSFSYQDLVGGGIGGNAPMTGTAYDGLFTFNASSLTSGEQPFGTGLNPIDSITYTITAAATANNAANGVIAGDVLLKLTAVTGLALPGDLLALNGTSSASFIVSDVGFDETLVTLSSGVINLAGISDESGSMGFSSDRNLSYTSTGLFSDYLNTFRANISGTFRASVTVPEPGTVALLFGLLSGSSLLVVRRRKIK